MKLLLPAIYNEVIKDYPLAYFGKRSDLAHKAIVLQISGNREYDRIELIENLSKYCRENGLVYHTLKRNRHKTIKCNQVQGEIK